MGSRGKGGKGKGLRQAEDVYGTTDLTAIEITTCPTIGIHLQEADDERVEGGGKRVKMCE